MKKPDLTNETTQLCKHGQVWRQQQSKRRSDYVSCSSFRAPISQMTDSSGFHIKRRSVSAETFSPGDGVRVTICCVSQNGQVPPAEDDPRRKSSPRRSHAFDEARHQQVPLEAYASSRTSKLFVYPSRNRSFI